jgi:hypothetical protein
MGPMALLPFRPVVRVLLFIVAVVAVGGCAPRSEPVTVQGVFREVGGPPGGSGGLGYFPLTGTVQAHEGGWVAPQEGFPKFGKVVATAAATNGEFTIVVPSPGTYTVTGRSPQMQGGAATCWSDPVHVTAGARSTAQVLCHIK